MSKIKRNISFSLALAAFMSLASFSAQAQDMGIRKSGTVLEQIQQSALYNDPNEELKRLLDYKETYKCAILEPIERIDAAIESGNEEEIRELLDYAATFKGTRYRRGASSPKGFDCSGFTSYVFAKFGYKLNRTSGSQINNGEIVEKDNLKPGDLVFFNGRKVGKRIGHVGIVTEVDSVDGTFQFIHASNSKGVTVSNSEETYYKKRYVSACRPTKN